MKKLLLGLCASIALSTGCAVYSDGPDYPVATTSGPVEFCDDYGCRWVNAPYYYDGAVVYWDAHFGCWIGPHGYWHGGVWYHGFHPGYHVPYGDHLYHRPYSHSQGWGAGSGYHSYHRGR